MVRFTRENFMDTIHFTAIVDQDQVIRPPSGVTLPEGALEVMVRPVAPPSTPQTDILATTRNWLFSLAKEAEKQAPALPNDMAERHDHYAHGKPS
jgi:hypothetical protein